MQLLMDMIRTSEYHVAHDSSARLVCCQGSLELGMRSEDTAVVALLDSVAAQSFDMITLDLRELDFCNGSGFSALCRFVIQIRQQQTLSLRVLGSKQSPCQNRLLSMFQQCMPSIQMDYC